MAEYVEREKVLSKAAPVEGCFSDMISAYDVVMLPAADVAPVRRGRWGRSGQLLECQCCGEVYSQLGGNAGKVWNFCPNCGCRMDGGDDE